MRTFSYLVASSLLTLIACDGGLGDGALTPSDVTGIPPGTATGNAASGLYDVELYTVGCRGACEARNGDLTGSICDVGEVENATITVTQLDGDLRMDVDGLIYDRLEGSLDADGTFVVGGYVTARAGAVEAMVLAEGSVTASAFAGTGLQRARGSNDGVSFDCVSDYELTGRRLR